MPRIEHLSRHAVTPAPGALGVAASATRGEESILSLRYVVEGEVDRLLVPEAGPIARGEYLWQHTCFEVFVRPKGSGAYYELNFAPSRQWDAYAFGEYRRGARVEGDALKPELTVRREPRTLELEARVDLTRMSRALAREPLALGLSAVLESREGALTYWALAHGPGQPDFHHADAFALEIA